MGNKFKKVVSTFVSLTTVLWSVGLGSLALPSAASAASLSTGTLVKASGPAVYYYAADGKRYVFPNEATYFSWYQNFSSVQTITDDELASLTIGGNVTIRPGTKLVKITTDPKTYAVTSNGTLHWIQSEAIAQALYGMNWAQRVVDVPDAFFTNYNTGAAISSNMHPDGTLVQYAGDSSTYVVWGGQKRKLADSSVVAANGYNLANAILTTIAYSNGADVTGRESALADVVIPGNVPTPGPISGSVNVALASDTPAGMTVPNNASSQKLLKVNFTAGSADASIVGLAFHRVGIGSTNDFANVYLYNGNGMRLSTGHTINSQTNIVQFNNLNITVAAGTTWSAWVVGDFAGSAITNTGGQHAFELADAGSVVLSGSGTVAGSFPVRGNVFTVGTTQASEVDIWKGSQPSNPTIGAQNAEVSNFKITANTNNVTLNSVTLYQAGNVSNSDLTNFQLYQGSTVVATAASIDATRHVVLKFTTPYVIPNGNTKVFSLHANVAGRANLTIRFYVEYSTDVSAMDNVYQSGASVCINNTAAGCSAYAGGASAGFDGSTPPLTTLNGPPATNGNFSEVVTQGGTLTNSFNGPATSNIAKGQMGVSLYNFALTSADNTLEVRHVTVTLAKTSASASTCKLIGSNGTHYFKSLKVVNTTTGQTVQGPAELTGSNGITTASITFNDTFDLAAGKTQNLSFEADLANSEDAGDTYLDGACAYQATMSAFGSNDIQVVDTGEFLNPSKIIPNAAVTGNTLTVKSSGLTVGLASVPFSTTLVKKQANVAIAGIVLTAAAQSDVTITNLTVTGMANIHGAGWANGGSNGFAQRVTSVQLVRADTGAVVGLGATPDTTTGKAQITNMNFLVPKGTSVTLLVQATFGSAASLTAPFDMVAAGVASAADIQAQDQDSNTVTPTVSASLVANSAPSSPVVVMTVLNNGTLNVSPDAQPVSNIVVAKMPATWTPMAQYKATAQYEPLNIDRVAVVASSTAGMTANNADFTSIAIAQNGAVLGTGTLSSGATGTVDIDLTGNPIVVPKDSSADFQIWAMLGTVQTSSTNQTSARSGDAPTLGLASNIQTGEWDANYAGKLNVKVTGAASGERLYAAAGATAGNFQILRKTVPIVTKQSLSSTTLTNVDQDLIKFQVAADTAGTAYLKQIIFKVSQTSGVTLSNFRMRSGTSDMNTSIYAMTNATSGADLQTGSVSGSNPSSSFFLAFTLKPGFEESIQGSGNVYTLHATVSGASAGQNVTVTFYRDPSAPIVTGYLLNSSAFGGFASNVNIYNIDTAAAPSGAASATGTFLWSDGSESQHSNVSQQSRDWTNDVYVNDLSQSQTVSL